MDFLNGKIKTLYFKYLAAAFGSALVTSIYSIVDMAMVGKYHGPAGTAALAVVAPVWNIIYSLGLLMGMGGSVLFSTIRGKGEGETRRSNEYFTVSMAGSLVLALAAWAAIACWDRPLLQFFGAEGETLTLAREYVRPIKFVIPAFYLRRRWRLTCEMTGTRHWPPPVCWRAAFSTCLAITSLFLPAIWGRLAPGWPPPLAP